MGEVSIPIPLPLLGWGNRLEAEGKSAFGQQVLVKAAQAAAAVALMTGGLLWQRPFRSLPLPLLGGGIGFRPKGSRHLAERESAFGQWVMGILSPSLSPRRPASRVSIPDCLQPLCQRRRQWPKKPEMTILFFEGQEKGKGSQGGSQHCECGYWFKLEAHEARFKLPV